jgi:transcriptional regulator with XRE-family HTH domain
MTAHAAGDTHDLPAPRPPADAADDLGASGRPEAAQQPAVTGERIAAPGLVLNPLQRLIGQRLRERGWSYGEVARRGGLPRSTVYTLATTRNLSRPPRPATIDALAVGLEVPVSAVRAAAAASTGLHYYDDVPAAGPGQAGDQGGPGDQERELLIASIDELTAEDRRHVAALVASLRNRSQPGDR